MRKNVIIYKWVVAFSKVESRNRRVDWVIRGLLTDQVIEKEKGR